jgi:hypothetical protein
MQDFINTADVLGEDELCDQIITRTIREYKENRITHVGNRALMGCTELETVVLPNVLSIANTAMYGCSKLVALALSHSSVVTLGNTDALKGTPIANGTGYIYVPSVLVPEYEVATNWNAYATQFRALEDYTVDGTVTGELDKGKI